MELRDEEDDGARASAGSGASSRRAAIGAARLLGAALALSVALAAIQAADASGPSARRQQQIRAHQLEAGGSKFSLDSGAQDDAQQRREISWHLNGHQPQVDGRQQAAAAAAASKQEKKAASGKGARGGGQRAAEAASEQAVEVFKMKQFESILALAASAAKVGALADDAGQQPRQQRRRQQQAHKTRQRPNATAAAAAASTTVVEFEPSELAKSMQMMSASIASNEAPPLPNGRTAPSSPPPPPPPPRQADKRKASARQMAANASEPSGDFASGFDEAALGPHESSLPPAPGSFELPPVGEQQHQQQHQQQHDEQHVDVDGDQLLERQHHAHHAHPIGPAVVVQPAAHLLDDYHAANGLSGLLDGRANYHDEKQRHEQHYENAASYSATSGDYAGAPAPHGHRKSAGGNIRVVFNNNPQFIIGSNARELAEGPGALAHSGGLAGAASSPLARKTRQPSAALYDDYHQDESAPDATKVASGGAAPCADKTHQQHGDEGPPRVNIEKVNMRDEPQAPVAPPPQPPPPPPPTQPPPTQQQQHEEPVQVPVQAPVAPKPAVRSKAPPAVVEQQQQQQQQQVELDEPVLTPFEQMVKSGARPPLRMVISMRNKHGDVMKVPINLHGSAPAAKTQQRPDVAELDLAQMQIQFERPAGEGQTQGAKLASRDENTPAGGDIFDPALIRPFERAPASVGKTSRAPASKAPASPQQQPEAEVRPRPQMRARSKDEERPVDIPQTYEAAPIAPTAPPPPPPPPQQVEQAVVQQQQKGDCQHEEAGQPVQAPLVLPISSEPNAGLVHMLMPRLTQVQNRTFAHMFSQFQQALSEHMNNHLASEQQQQRKETQRQEDEREDLMVALMAAGQQQQQQQQEGAGGGQTRPGALSMTVIKPPKGTSLQEAIASHARAGQTMAILSSAPGRRLGAPANKLDGGEQTPASDGGGAAVPVAVDVRLRQASPAGGQNQGASPSSAGGEADPDGFSSAASSAASLRPAPSVTIETIDLSAFAREHWPAHKRAGRFRRSAPAAPEAGDHLEPADKLANQTAAAAGREKDGLKKSQGGKLARLKAAVANQTEAFASKRASGSAAAAPKKRQRLDGAAAGDFLAAASQTSESSSEPDSEEADEGGGDGPDEMEADEEPGAHSGDLDEPAASASGESGNNAESGAGPNNNNDNNNGAPEDGDYASDMGDDFDSAPASGGFDNDDEPYNQAAASDRDYSGASSSFEIPSIDINPSTLQQKGCRTVLREVQEIPLNGLGAVQADGRPGSGFASAGAGGEPAASSVGALRVRRQAPPSSSLINSRKVTSIVMTKECHFPSESAGAAAGGRRQRPAAAGGQQAVERVAFGEQGGASQARAAIAQRPSGARPQAGAPQQRQQQQQQQQQLVVPQNYPTYQLLKAPESPPPPPPPEVVSFYQPQLVARAPTKAQQPTARSPVGQQQKRPVAANFFAVAASQPASQQLQPSASSIRRRSVPFEPAQLAADARRQQQKQQQRRQQNEAHRPAASGVVARKSYKPPSEDDPYHTLSYSSQTGADPDMEQDEDDSVVMGPDSPQPDSAESGRVGQQNGRRRGEARASGSRGTLSERERAALMDPNRDDTDPESEEDEELAARPPGQARRQQSAPSKPPGRISAAASSTTNERPGGAGGKKQQRRREFEAEKSLAGDEPSGLGAPEDADENDGDLTDESRPETQLRALPRPPPAPIQARPQLPVRAATKARRPASGEMARANGRPAQGVAGEPARFGKSFKFEHELSRVGPSAAAAAAGARRADEVTEHLRQLKPGLQGYVATRGGVGGAQGALKGGPAAANSARPLASANQLRAAVAATIGRRSDGDDDDDDDLDDDDEAAGQQRGRGAASGRRQQLAATPEGAGEAEGDGEDEENPDADPELNPRESQLPAHSKPKRFEKSFAYVHRDLPKKGARNPDDFVVSYGRGNLQTEHEDYDSDREPAAAHANPSRGGGGGGGDQERRAAASQLSGPTVARRPRGALNAGAVRVGPQMRLRDHQLLARRPGSLAQSAGRGQATKNR